VSGICFYVIGWAFAYGDSTKGNPFIGDWTFALSDWCARRGVGGAAAGDGGWRRPRAATAPRAAPPPLPGLPLPSPNRGCPVSLCPPQINP
jgi:hypothetical protein